MSTQSALNARTAVENALTVVGIELLCGAQAMEFVDDRFAPGTGTGTGAAYETVRDEVPPLDADRPLHAEIDTVTKQVSSGELETHVGNAVEKTIE